MNELKKVIILVIIIIVICLMLLLHYGIGKKEQDNVEIHASEVMDTSDIKPTKVKEKNQFYTIENCLRKYIAYYSLNVSEQYDEDLQQPSLAAVYGINTDEQKRQAIYNLLDKQYIEEKGVTVNKVYDKIGNIVGNMDVSIKSMYKLVDNEANIESYSMYCTIENLEDETEEELDKYYVIKIDKHNETFCVYPLEKDKYSDINIKNTIKNIEKNNQNTLIYTEINDGEMATKYFQNYKNMILNEPENAYNLLDEEYRKKRFGDIEKYKKYVQNNRKELEVSNIQKYLINSYSDYSEYICQNQYGNIYIFKVNAVMEYTVKLDAYTIETNKFKETYKVANEQKRVMLNVDKWIQMLNNRDYNAAYNVLDETFRNQNFGSLEKFEEHMRKFFPAHYEVVYGEFSNTGNLYTQKVELKDIEDTSKAAIEKTIIMQLGQDINFDMSFNVQRH